jgi:hypothetical protein
LRLALKMDTLPPDAVAGTHYDAHHMAVLDSER